MKPNKGFTLFELIVTVAVLAILAMIAAPSMVNLIKSSKVKTTSSAIVDFMQQARSEAIRTGRPVTVCASSNGSTCVDEDKDQWNVGLVMQITNPDASVIYSVLKFDDPNLEITGPEITIDNPKSEVEFNSVGAISVGVMIDKKPQVKVTMIGQDTYSVCIPISGRAERIKGSTCP
ncbi:GspH/FimT family pseudopilin [Acinetobacter indicus]|uniref:GspH/FimT family pseudopilin n=1 Tax=Acinetobacter indicus TaxID=756892 RepID=UPI00257494FE|nr:GspH/FimT family pseudopilin [Acinetobacter indicus]MDM1311453.1 GspH/FimT family pseudopilin [Acinetobacter indicus]